MAEELRVLVTGAAGQIAYSLLFAIAKGDVFGKDQPIALVMLDIPPMAQSLQGVCMELEDCALPNLKTVVASTNVAEAFANIDYAVLVGAMPRREGMERKDLLKANVKIFSEQGKALEQHAKKTVKVLVVGNPANTNCLVAMTNAPSIPKSQFTCLTRLDQNRAQAQIAMKLGVSTQSVSNVTIWGNHSSTQYPDVSHGTVNVNGETKSIQSAVNDDNWLHGEFIKTVQSRGGAVIKARKLSSAMSAAKAICDHLRDWHFGRSNGWTSMGIVTDGKHYGIPENLVYSMPCHIKQGGEWTIAKDLEISDFSRQLMAVTCDELKEEKETAFAFLQI